MSSETLGYVFATSPFKGATFLTHLVIGDLVSDIHDYEIWCTQGWLADRSRVSVRGIQRALDELIEGEWLSLIEDNSLAGKPNKYRFEFPVDNPKMRRIGPDTVSGGVRNLVQNPRHLVVQNSKNSNEQNRENREDLPTGYFAPGTGWISEYRSDKDTS